MTFYATEINVAPAFGWQGGPNIDVLIKRLRNKAERRQRIADLVMHTYTLPFKNVTDTRYLAYIKAAFMAMGGPHHSFLVKDYGDYTHGDLGGSTPMPFALGDAVSTSFFLSKRYSFGTAYYDRPITKPVAGAVIYVDGVATVATVNALTGEVVFGVAPANGAVLAWSGEFRVPVRFTEFFLPSTIDNRSGQNRIVNGSCTLQEVFGED